MRKITQFAVLITFLFLAQVSWAPTCSGGTLPPRFTFTISLEQYTDMNPDAPNEHYANASVYSLPALTPYFENRVFSTRLYYNLPLAGVVSNVPSNLAPNSWVVLKISAPNRSDGWYIGEIKREQDICGSLFYDLDNMSKIPNPFELLLVIVLIIGAVILIIKNNVRKAKRD